MIMMERAAAAWGDRLAAAAGDAPAPFTQEGGGAGCAQGRPARRRPGVAVAFLWLALAVAGAGLGRGPAQPEQETRCAGVGNTAMFRLISATITMAGHTLMLDLMVVRNPGLHTKAVRALYILSSGPNQRMLDAITPIVARPVPRSRACQRSVGSPATVRDASKPSHQ